MIITIKIYTAGQLGEEVRGAGAAASLSLPLWRRPCVQKARERIRSKRH